MPTSYFFPTDNSRAQAVSLAPFGSGIIVPEFTQPLSWFYNGTSLAVSSVYLLGGAYGAGAYGAGPYPNGPLASSCGFSDVCAAGSQDVYMTQYTGSLVHITSGGIFNSYTLPSGSAFIGVTYVSAFSGAYCVNNAGSIYTTARTNLILVGSYFPSGGMVYGSGFYGSGLYSSFALGVSSVWDMATSGTTLFSFSPGTLQSFTLSSASGGSGIPINAPIEIPLCIAASQSGFVALGGWNQATIGNVSGASGIVNIAFDTVNSNALALRPTPSSRVDLYTGPSEVWTLVQSMSGITNPTNAAWDNDGVHAIVTDPVSGAAYGLTYALSHISITNTVTGLTGAGAVTIQPDDITAFVCQPSSNALRQLNLVGTNWVTGASFPLTGVSTVQTLTIPFEIEEGFTVPISGVAVGYSSGVAFLTGNTQTYTVTTTVPLTYTPTSLAIDSSGNVLACGTSGSLGIFTPFTGTASGQPVTWPGSAIDMIYNQGQVVIFDGVNNVLQYLGQYTGVPYSIYNTTGWTFTSGISGIALAVSPLTATASGGTVFVMSSGGNGYAYQSHFVGPFNLYPAASGVVGIYSSGAWTTVALNPRDAPTALTFDLSGNISVATRNNFLYSIATSGTIRSSAGIPVYGGQSQTTSLGISDMITALGHIWGSSCFNGALIELG